MARNPARIRTLINTKKWDKVKLNLKKLNNAYTAIGFFSKDTNSEGALMAAIAAVHEFGWGNSPERSFMRAWFDGNKKKIEQMQNKLYNQILIGRISPETGLKRLGEWAQGEIRQFIIELKDPPNKAVTIAAKGSSSPLIDTGQMVNTVRHEEFYGRKPE